MSLEFDAAAHRYTLDGRDVPSVTQALAVLDSYIGVPPGVLEYARQRGDAVHIACDLLDREELDWATLDPVLVPYVEGYRNWLADTGAVVLSSEAQVASPRFQYAGTLDRTVAIGKRLATLAVVELKATATVMPTVGPQTAAYAQACAEAGKVAGPLRRVCLHLTPNKGRGYSLHQLADPADWAVFQSCLNIYNWRKRHG